MNTIYARKEKMILIMIIPQNSSNLVRSKRNTAFYHDC